METDEKEMVNYEPPCEHNGNKWSCLKCEIKLLKMVIEEQKKRISDTYSTVSLLHYRGYINYTKKGCPSNIEIEQLLRELS